MIQKALDWARKSKNIRVSEIHGEEEIYMVLNETFCHKEVQEEENTKQGSFAVEAGYIYAMWQVLLTLHRYRLYLKDTMVHNYPSCSCQDENGTLLDSDLPDLSGGDANLAGPAANPNANAANAAPNASGILSFKRGS